jgi:tetratricopeptide (TPR) repeat protein
MRIVLYLIVLGFLAVACTGNQNKQIQDETANPGEGSTSANVSDTSFNLPDNTKGEPVSETDISDEPGSDVVEEETTRQQEFVPKLDGRQGKDKFKNTVEYHYKRGLVLFKVNNYVEGIKEFDSAIAMDPGRTSSYINRGKGLMELKRWEAARRDFEQAVNLDSRDTTTYLYLAMAQYQLGDYEAAVETNTEVIILAPRKAKGYYNRGIAYGVMKEYNKAIADFNQAIAINPKYAEAFYNRGLAYYFSGDKNAACEDWELAKFYGSRKAVGAIDNYCK